MTPEMTLLIALFFGLMMLGVPVAFAIGISGFSFFAISAVMPASIGVQQVASASQSFPLLAVPFFVLAGHMMNKTGITKRLIRCSEVLVSWMAGGMAQVCIVLSTLMGGVSGSAVADAAMEARILGPDLIRNGYSKGFTCATIAVCSLITATIPPSLGLILYGFVGGVSIGRLFLAGIIPGFLMMAILMFTVWVISRKRGYRSATAERPSWKAMGAAINDAKWALLFPVALLVAIRGGLFTPSEVGAFAVVYAVVVGVVLHRELTWKDAMDALLQGAIDNGLIVLIIMFSGMVGYAIIFAQAPQAIAAAMLGLSHNPLVMLGMIVVFLLIAGCFVEATVLVLLLTPIFLPIVRQLGVDDVHFGIVMMTMVTFGGMTPPVGVAMFTVCGLLDCSVDEYLVEALPHIAAILVLVAVLVLFPGLSLFLPNLLM
jgi:TRAP-type transport system large permease protein